MRHFPRILLLFLLNLLFVTLIDVEFSDYDPFTGEAVVRHHPYANIVVLFVFTLLLYYFQYQNVLYHVRKKASALQNINPITFVFLFFLFFLYLFLHHMGYPLVPRHIFDGEVGALFLFLFFIIYFFIVRAFFKYYSSREFSNQNISQKK